jgi:sigma-B regulation protein RsbU (phosphoserine phosphatase)
LSPDGKTKDGMDMSLARLNLKTKELQWAGANNPLWVIRKSKNILDTIAPDKQPVGYSDNMHPFTNNEIQLMEGDIFYLITDGYADQFGGPKGKKFKYKQLKEILLEMLHKPFDEQKNVLNTTIENWKGNLEQVDDILIVGVNV